MILVTGAGGTVGGEIVKQLRAAGAKFSPQTASRKESSRYKQNLRSG